MAGRNRASRAARAAVALLQDRVRFIEHLENAHAQERHAWAAAEQAHAHAREKAKATAEAYQAALDAGWTTTELRQLGYPDKRTRRGRRTNAAASQPVPIRGVDTAPTATHTGQKQWPDVSSDQPRSTPAAG